MPSAHAGWKEGVDPGETRVGRAHQEHGFRDTIPAGFGLIRTECLFHHVTKKMMRFPINIVHSCITQLGGIMGASMLVLTALILMWKLSVELKGLFGISSADIIMR